MKHARQRIEEIMRGDEGTLADAEEFIDAGKWSSDQKAALWLYAWSLQSHGVQRAGAALLLEYAG